MPVLSPLLQVHRIYQTHRFPHGDGGGIIGHTDKGAPFTQRSGIRGDWIGHGGGVDGEGEEILKAIGWTDAT